MITILNDRAPKIDKRAFVAPTASVIGDVHIGPESSVWFGAVVRGDFNKIRIGKRTNVQDLSLMHTPDNLSCTVGDEVTIGHRAVVHGCTVGNRVLVGMGAILMNDVVIEDDVIVGAGALVTEGTKIPSGSLVIGFPAKVKRKLTEDEMAWLKTSADHYANNAKQYLALFT
jgi:carbonic anhydrase/acetyltransferase-like protein (isoleucine patch superfamily)